MRPSLSLAFVLAAFPAAVLAGTPDDRYGPPAAVEDAPAAPIVVADNTPAPQTAAAPAYHGKFLNWSNKSAPPRVVAAPEARPVVSAPPAAVVVPARRVEAVSPPADSVMIRRKAPETATAAPATATRKPTVVLSAPPVVAPAPVAAVATPALPTIVPVAKPAPIAVAAATPGAVSSAPSASPVRARFYSLHRQYGDRPDGVVVPADRPPVLIGPSDASVAGDEDATDAKSAKSDAKPVF